MTRPFLLGLIALLYAHAVQAHSAPPILGPFRPCSDTEHAEKFDRTMKAIRNVAEDPVRYHLSLKDFLECEYSREER
ncbi:MAG: hypothetical protein JO171_16975 [Paludibacterium sp.]|uniref:hypothetical protein n=1 Tax=Paludibacterium sp. TaxID=1917523 RepID=UPI0025FF781F|nr:hypothetical protein [Paludibacterium sp.]MBV8048844.1 hypothetical protein [Paludibacterium sp.]MBV8646499.1 hypothetical protein [Paludibacterium sp.]